MYQFVCDFEDAEQTVVTRTHRSLRREEEGAQDRYQVIEKEILVGLL